MRAREKWSRSRGPWSVGAERGDAAEVLSILFVVSLFNLAIRNWNEVILRRGAHRWRGCK
ncbi:hypothetical protein HBB16_05350 [Pseudonocardia sp. MCCB 268]|nr:hypothetical protein [Pseudonocardia cytotoxica]